MSVKDADTDGNCTDFVKKLIKKDMRESKNLSYLFYYSSILFLGAFSSISANCSFDSIVNNAV